MYKANVQIWTPVDYFCLASEPTDTVEQATKDGHSLISQAIYLVDWKLEVEDEAGVVVYSEPLPASEL